MKVAFIEQESQLGGVEYTTLRLARALDPSRFTSLIICPEEGKLPDLARRAGLEVEILARPKFASVSWFVGNRYIANPFGIILSAFNVLRAARQMQKYLKANPVQVVITKGLMAHFYGSLAAWRLHIPCIWYVQEEVDKHRGGGAYRFVLAEGAKRLPSKIVVDALALLDQFEAIPNYEDTIQVIYNGVDTDQFVPFSNHDHAEAHARFGIPEDALVIGQAARLIPSKGQAILLDAFIKLVRQFPDLHLVFVGTSLFGRRDYEQALRNRAAKAGLAERVHFTGFIPDVRQGLAAMDVFVHASVETDSPVSLTEAMSCGLPVVVSAVPGTIEMVTSENDACVFRSGNSDALALSLARLIKDDHLRMEMGARARVSVIRKFSLQASVTKFESLLEAVYAAQNLFCP